MDAPEKIPVYNLFGETGAFPDVIHCERIRDRARLHDWTITPHRHREMAQLFFMQQGAVEAAVDDRAVTLKDRELLFVPALCVHGFRFRQGSEGLVISFPSPVVSGLQAASPDLARRLSAPFVAAVDTALAGLLSHLAATFQDFGIYRTQLLVTLSHAALVSACEAAARKTAADLPDERSARMRQFRALVAEGLHKGGRAGDYARALSITPGHLNRICQSATGMSATRYIEGMVMAEACRLLAFTRMPVTGIGYSLGYEDPAHFSRRFRVVQGKSPKAYRKPFGG